jgi:fatty-acyl-CoA synthase
MISHLNDRVHVFKQGTPEPTKPMVQRWVSLAPRGNMVMKGYLKSRTAKLRLHLLMAGSCTGDFKAVASDGYIKIKGQAWACLFIILWCSSPSALR